MVIGTLLACVTVAAAVRGFSAQGQERPTVKLGVELLRKEAALRERPALTIGVRGGDAGPSFTEIKEVRAQAERQAETVPLPPGGTFDDIKWDEFGEATPTDIQFLLEANAACDWWNYVGEAQGAEVEHVISGIPEWPTMRANEGVGQTAREVTAAVGRGDLDYIRQVGQGCKSPPRVER